MQQAIRKSTGLESKLIEGSGGVFDVRIDGSLIFSHFQTGRFPKSEEILAKIQELQKP
ncbi:MAG: SelT/SelW/SelH family protein [Candidatus Tectomicrobia bacterium]|uniref:SelT/SelW/SelH family protein n=1 Tax=Tectimicrobiota bacterium TaxID=2528274 RepID=A0A932M1C5_UNCTE|nr:SelT/SelW/SelH family protein [Candidatus Tectomicrobia bacterium]